MMELMWRAALGLSGLLLASPLAPPTNPDSVSATEWRTLLTRAGNGGVINLGQRSVDFVRQKFQPTHPVVIRGGVFGPIVLDQWQNVTFEGSSFSAPIGTVEYQSLIVANRPENLAIRNSHFTGYRGDNGQLRIRGVSIRQGKDVTIDNSVFEGMAGVNGFHKSSGIRFTNNVMRTIREGVQIQGGDHILLEGNKFEDFQPFKGDHADAIQFFTTGIRDPAESASHHVVIRRNLISADGKSQAILVGDELKLAAMDRGYKAFLIEDNLIIGAVWHGITAATVNDLTIRNNRVFRIAGRDIKGSRITAGGENAVVEDNQADAFIFRDNVRERHNRRVAPLSAEKGAMIVAAWEKAR